MVRQVYYVKQTGAKLRYGQKGGGLFASEQGALGRAKAMRQAGASVEIYTATVEWEPYNE